MANLIRGQQLADAPLGITTSKINDDQVTSAKVDGSVLSTDAANTPPANDYSALGKKIIDLAPGTLGTDAVNYSQLLAVQQGMAWKAACETATVDVNGNAVVLPNTPVFAGAPGGPGGTLTSSVNTPLVVGNVNVTKIGQRVLVTGYSGPIDGPKNGIYELTQAGFAGPIPAPQPWILTRVADMDVTAEVARAATTVDNTNSYGFGKVYVVSFPLAPIGAWVLNVDIITWATLPLPAALIAGQGISISGLTISVDITATDNAAARGLTFTGNKLEISLTANAGLKFNDTTGRLETLLTSTPNVEGGLKYGANGGLAAKFEPNSGLTVGANAGLVINPKNNAVPSAATGGLALVANELVAQVNLNAALRVNNVNQIELNVEPSTPTTGGLEIGPGLGIQSKWDPNGGITYSAVGGKLLLGNPLNLPVGLLLSAAGVYNNVVNVEQSGAALATTVQGEALFGALTETPFKANGKNAVIFFFLNGVKYRVGPSIANDPVYFSNDGGVTARALNAITVGDIPYRGGAFLFPTLISDEVNIDYLSAVP